METPNVPPPRFLDPTDEATLARLRAAERVGLDTESNPFHRYFERVCLLQISDAREDLLVDPIVADGLADPIRALLAAPGPVKVLHGADSDVRALKQSFDLTLGAVFDTQLAAQFLGREKTGLKDLLALELGVEVDKGEQRSDWGRRPLTDQQIAYAAQDSRHLVALAAKLEAELAEKGRLHWHAEECAAVLTREPTEKVFDPESWRKIKGSRDLGPVGRRVLSAAVAWRDEVARSDDRPAFRIVRSEALLQLSRGVERKGVDTLNSLMKSRGMPTGGHRTGLRQAIEAGLDRPDPGRNRPRKAPKVDPRAQHPFAKKRREALRAERQTWAAGLGLDPGFLLPASVSDQVVQRMPRDLAQLREVPGVSEWRIEAIGQEISAWVAVMESQEGC